MFPEKPEHASPYSPASRNFLNILYIDVEAIAEFRTSLASDMVETQHFKAALERCRASTQVEYFDVTRLKLDALRAVFEEFREHALQSRKLNFLAFVEAGGESLWRSSLFQVLRNHFSRVDRSADDWHQWPEPLQSTSSREVIDFAKEHHVDIEFFSWLQWIADQQLAKASQAASAAGMEVGLYRDLAVGCDRSGCEAWAKPSDFLRGAYVGAPPDILNPAGQNWGLPLFNPAILQKEAYKPFVDLVRVNMRHAGGLRIDHIMGLQGLYCIPEGSPASEGAYISYPSDDLIGIIALESHRNRCLVVGEDLGTVPLGFERKWPPRTSSHIGLYSSRRIAPPADSFLQIFIQLWPWPSRVVMIFRPCRLAGRSRH